MLTNQPVRLKNGSVAINLFQIGAGAEYDGKEYDGKEYALVASLAAPMSTASIEVPGVEGAALVRVVAPDDGAVASLSDGVVDITFGARGAVVVVLKSVTAI